MNPGDLLRTLHKSLRLGEVLVYGRHDLRGFIANKFPEFMLSVILSLLKVVKYSCCSVLFEYSHFWIREQISSQLEATHGNSYTSGSKYGIGLGPEPSFERGRGSHERSAAGK